MITNYNFEIDDAIVKVDIKRLVNQIWKLIPMRENGEGWEVQLAVIIEEISGLHKIFSNKLDFLILLSKLEGLTSEVCNDFMIYRKTVFRCIDLLSKVIKDAQQLRIDEQTA